MIQVHILRYYTTKNFVISAGQQVFLI